MLIRIDDSLKKKLEDRMSLVNEMQQKKQQTKFQSNTNTFMFTHNKIWLGIIIYFNEIDSDDGMTNK